MAIDGAVALYEENAGDVYHARGFRRQLNRIDNPFDIRTLGGLATSGPHNGGVTRSYDLAVSQRGAGANMSVDVSAGGAIIGGTQNAHQGEYFAYNDAVVNVPISAANATNPRIDVIGVKVLDQEYGDGSDTCSLVVVAGTPNPSPAVPTLPANFLTLAHVAVAANATTIVTANITNKRLNLYLPRWETAWGQVAGSTISSSTDVSTTTTVTDTGLTSGSITPLAANRIYEVRFCGHVYSSGNTSPVAMYLTDGSNNVLGVFDAVVAPSVGQIVAFAYNFQFTISTTTAFTWKLRFNRAAAGTDTVHFFADSTRIAQMTVLDCGNSGNPA